MRRGRIGAKKLTSEPVTAPWYGPGAGHHQLLEERLVADAHPLLHVGDLRLRLRVPCAGFIRPKIAPVTVSMIAVETSSSISE